MAMARFSTRARHSSIGSIRVGRGNFGIEGLPLPESWMLDGLCGQVDPELWYPDKGASTRGAKRVCKACPVADRCLRYALDHDEPFGIWGGKTRQERLAMLPIESEELRYRVATVQYLTAQGWPVKAIAAELGISYVLVCRDRKRPPVEFPVEAA